MLSTSIKQIIPSPDWHIVKQIESGHLEAQPCPCLALCRVVLEDGSEHDIITPVSPFPGPYSDLPLAFTDPQYRGIIHASHLVEIE